MRDEKQMTDLADFGARLATCVSTGAPLTAARQGAMAKVQGNIA
ncbi:hypothetical protein [Cupriavidus yeoncheonensis]|nr:hypothetical protein [Cupriavidus yeoncheonensis]